jgi:RimJ/RimL family protein N-acetyltransferase
VKTALLVVRTRFLAVRTRFLAVKTRFLAVRARLLIANTRFLAARARLLVANTRFLATKSLLLVTRNRLVERKPGIVDAVPGCNLENATMTRTTILETPRLLLCEMTEADAEHLLALGQNPNVMRYIPGEPPVTTLDDALAVLRERVFPQYAHGIGRWACIEKTSGAFIGWCGVKHMPDDDEYDVGYRFFEEHWAKGYATESARAVCDFARRHLAGKRVVGKAMRDNVGSRRVLEKLGLVYEGEIETEGGPTAVYVLVV